MNASEPAPNAARPAFLDRLPEVLSFQLKFLFFRTSREEMLAVGWPHFLWGLFATWIAGVGRWWDDDDAVFLQILGLGSVVYVFLLAALLWIVVRPLIAPDWKYGRVVTLLMFTSPLAWLYAVPVEMFLPIERAARVNLWFLAIVALWRVVILFRLLAVIAGFGAWRCLVAGSMPLTVIVAVLFILNLHNVTIEFMSNIRNVTFDPDRAEFGLLLLLFVLSVYAAPVLFFMWLGLISASRLDLTGGADEVDPEATPFDLYQSRNSQQGEQGAAASPPDAPR